MSKRFAFRVFFLGLFFLPQTSLFCDAQTDSESLLYSFCSQANCTDGAGPYGGLIQASDGNFYGTTYYGGASGHGSIFRIDSAGNLTTVYSFLGGASGSNPQTSLVQGLDGNLYGTTYFGGPEEGIVFRISTSGAFTVIHNFCSESDCTDGGGPAGALTQGADGNFYSTVQYGGGDEQGAVFKLTPSGAFTVLYNFADEGDGGGPIAGLVQAGDGAFYGTTATGGSTNNGVFFKITSSGTYTVLASFDGINGAAPWATLIEGADGDFYGTTTAGGSEGGNGTVFRASPSGVISDLVSFGGGYGGSHPDDSVILGSDGNFYGTNSAAGLNDCGNSGCGTIFEIDPSANVTTLYQFTGSQGDDKPYSGLLQGSDGNFYGSALGLVGTGIVAAGALYEISPSPALAPPVQLKLSSKSIALGSSVTLSWEVLNAFSLTMQQCSAFVQNGDSGAGHWSGVQGGSYSAQTKLYQGSSILTPTAVGSHTYALTCGGVESGFAAVTVKGASSTLLSALPDPVTVGQTITLSATVAGSAPTPTGTVTFSIDSISLGTRALTGGISTLIATTNGAALGIYPVVAAYSGDGNYNSSSSPAYNVTLNKAVTRTALVASPNPVTPPATCTITATVSRTAGSGFATGTVTFSIGSAVIGSAKLNASGVAGISVDTMGLQQGSYAVIATYAGDGSDTGSASSVLTVTVK